MVNLSLFKEQEVQVDSATKTEPEAQEESSLVNQEQEAAQEEPAQEEPAQEEQEQAVEKLSSSESSLSSKSSKKSSKLSFLKQDWLACCGTAKRKRVGEKKVEEPKVHFKLYFILINF